MFGHSTEEFTLQIKNSTGVRKKIIVRAPQQQKHEATIGNNRSDTVLFSHSGNKGVGAIEVRVTQDSIEIKFCGQVYFQEEEETEDDDLVDW